MVREVFLEVMIFKLLSVFKKESPLLGSEGRMFMAERTARTKALGSNELGVLKKEKGNQFCWNMVRCILGDSRAHIRFKNIFFQLY